MSTATPNQAPPDQSDRLRRLRRLNIIAAVVHGASGVAVLALANDFSIPITAAYPAGPPGTPTSAPIELLATPFAWGVATFFFLSAFFHLLVAFPSRRTYEAGLADGHNYFRWAEYSVSSSVMIVLIAQLCGITDAGALIGIAAVNACMILFGWLQEKYGKPGNGDMLPFAFGSFAGVIPWLIIILYALAPGSGRETAVPGFVWAIIVTLFLLFNCFALVQYLQYKPVGRFADYLVGEKTYLVLSLVAKIALAWQVFAGTLAA